MELSLLIKLAVGVIAALIGIVYRDLMVDIRSVESENKMLKKEIDDLRIESARIERQNDKEHYEIVLEATKTFVTKEDCEKGQENVKNEKKR